MTKYAYLWEWVHLPSGSIDCGYSQEKEKEYARVLDKHGKAGWLLCAIYSPTEGWRALHVFQKEIA